MNPRQAKALGKFLKERRTALGLSTRALAARSDVDMATIVRLEQGAFAEPRTDKLRAIATVDGSGQWVTPIQWGGMAFSLAKKRDRKAEKLPKSYSKLWKEPG